MLDLKAYKCEDLYMRLESAYDKDIWENVKEKRSSAGLEKDDHFHHDWYAKNTKYSCCLDFKKAKRTNKEYLKIFLVLCTTKKKSKTSSTAKKTQDVSKFLNSFLLGKKLTLDAFVCSIFSYDSSKYNSTIGIPFDAGSMFIAPEIDMAHAKIKGLEIAFPGAPLGLDSVTSKITDNKISIHLHTKHKIVNNINLIEEILLHCSQLSGLFVKRQKK